jgi:hypothetical protein
VADEHLKELKRGIDRWIKFATYAAVLCIVLDILPHLPDELGKKVADKLLAAVGLD